MASLALDARTAVVTLSHDAKIDEPALASALESEAFYIGALGSKRTHAKRLMRLRSRGFDDDTLARICGPIGLHLGGRSPAEIAVAILAQIDPGPLCLTGMGTNPNPRIAQSPQLEWQGGCLAV